VPEFAYYAIYEVESECFIRFGKRLSTDNLHSYWLDDISAVVFSVNELDLIVHWARTGDTRVGAMSYHVIQFIEETCKIENLVCVPCDEHFNNVDYENAFPILEL